MGGRQYYSLLMPLSEIPHLFKFDDWELCTPEGILFVSGKVRLVSRGY